MTKNEREKKKSVMWRQTMRSKQLFFFGVFSHLLTDNFDGYLMSSKELVVPQGTTQKM